MLGKYHSLYVNTVKEVAALSTCSRIKVGAIAVKNGRILLSGWNGVLPGRTHCCDLHDTTHENFNDIHRIFSHQNESHAEMSLIGIAANEGIKLGGTTLITTLSPCNYCAKLIAMTAFKDVFYIDKYDRETEGIQLLNSYGIPCIQITGSLNRADI